MWIGGKSSNPTTQAQPLRSGSRNFILPHIIICGKNIPSGVGFSPERKLEAVRLAANDLGGGLLRPCSDLGGNPIKRLFAPGSRQRTLPDYDAVPAAELPTLFVANLAPHLLAFGGIGRQRLFFGGFIPAFARCCFCIAASLLVFTSPMRTLYHTLPPAATTVYSTTLYSTNVVRPSRVLGKQVDMFSRSTPAPQRRRYQPSVPRLPHQLKRPSQ